MADTRTAKATEQKANSVAKDRKLTPEQIRLVAEKVYRMLLKDMELARERTGRSYMGSRISRTIIDRQRW